MASTAMGTLFDWWWPARFGTQAPQEARDDIAAALAAMLRPVATGPKTFVHRDFFAGNLLWMPDRRVSIIDFQGAAIGHPAYDLVSLLQDARRDIPPASRRRALDRYLFARPELDAEAFRAAFIACAAQRHLRVACQWVRLALRDNRPQYLAYGPRTWRLLEDALAEQAAEPLALALNRWIPAAARGNPPDLPIPGPDQPEPDLPPGHDRKPGSEP
jgi:aminoglycoside/choline kinase family phosphotransferase